ncbi:MAG: hypothetical protein HC944_05190 [Nanoarchaeota archaeon]|nr:hypothetical protein [Nanoarchaeota archaeon]
MNSIPMEKIQFLWESGQVDQLMELIVSETDLTYDETKRVVLFFEKYDKRHYDEKSIMTKNIMIKTQLLQNHM